MADHSTHRPDSKESPKVFVSNHAMVVRIRGEFTDRELQVAIDRLRPRHKALIPELEADDPVKSHFVLRILPESQGPDWKEVVKAELLEPFPAGIGPFARFILLRRGVSADLVAVFHHGACDGMSGVYALRDLLTLLADPGLVLPPLDPPPNTFALIPETVKNNRRVKNKIRAFLTSFRFFLFFQRLRRRFSPSGGGLKESSPASRRICVLTHTLTAEQTAQLAARCKAEGTTVHAALCAAWLTAFAESLEGRKSWVRSVSSPVSLRDRLSIPETSGLFLATVVTKVNCAPGRNFWQVAREFKQKLNLATTDENVFFFPLTIGAVFSHFSGKAMKEIMPALFDRPVKYDFSVTNLGRLAIPEDNGSLHMEAFYNLVNTSDEERTVCVNTFAGRLTWSYLFRESKMDPQEAEKLVKAVLAKLFGAIVE